MFLLEGHSAPDHAILARFRSIHFAPCSKRILAEVSNILFDLGEIAFIKPANYEISKTRKYKNDIGKIENMEYDKISDFYTCKNNRKLTVSHIRHNKTKTGYVSEKTIYTCENCSDCPCKSDCIKGNGLRMYSLKVLF